MADFGITRFGAYVPRLRIDRAVIAEAHGWMAPGLKGQAKGKRAFASWDEDAVTMAVEAGRDCLDAGSLSEYEALVLASTNLPYTDRSEEHTSELQSLMRNSYAVFCLKKKNIATQNLQYTNTGQTPRTNDNSNIDDDNS